MRVIWLCKRRARAVTALVGVASLAVFLGACSSGSSSGSSSSNSGSSSSSSPEKLIAVTQVGPCSINTFGESFCAGVAAAKKKLAGKFNVELHAGASWADLDQYSNLIQNVLTLHPAAIAQFSIDENATVPILTQACAQGVKVIIIDQQMPRVTCATSTVAADWTKLGTQLVAWLKAHPIPGNKQYEMITYAPGQLPESDNTVNAFKAGAAALGYKLVDQIGSPSGGLQDQIETAVQNMITAHPQTNIMFSASDSFDPGLTQALKATGKLHTMVRMSIDGAGTSVAEIYTGGMTADAAKSGYLEGYNSVMAAAKAADGQAIPKFLPDNTQVIDASNAHQFLANEVNFLGG